MAKASRGFSARFQLPPKEPAENIDDGIAFESKDGPMTEEDLGALIDAQIQDAQNYESTDLTQIRETALKFYEGEVDFSSPKGRSQLVSRDLSDVHGLILPGLMRVFLATTNIAIFNPATERDEPFAQQATDYVNYVIMRECDGYQHFRSVIHDSLLFGNGVVKEWWDDTPLHRTESFSGLSEDAFTMLANDPSIDEVIELEEYDDPDWVPPQQPLPMPATPLLAGPGGMPAGGMPPPIPPELLKPPKLYDCKVKRCVSRGRLRLMALPPEDFRLGRGAISLDEKDDRLRFAAHRWVKTRSSLIEEGADPETVYELPEFSSVNLDTPEQLARDPNHLFEGDKAPDKATQLVEGWECYIRCDFDGDGVAEWIRADVAGLDSKRTLLSFEEWGDEFPFTDVVVDPMPHRWRGRSLFDTMYDVQRAKTAILRQGMDNLYLTQNPRQFVTENAVVNPEVLDDWEIGSICIERTANSVRFEQTPFVADKAFLGLEYFDQVVERRTGGATNSLALDPETLQEQTATAVNAAQTAAHSKIEEYARNIAEHGGLQRIFSKALKLICKHQDQARTIRLRDKWIPVDPRAWNADMDVTINVGLGSGSRERDLAMLAQIAQKQEQLCLTLGPVNPICGIDKLMETYRLAVEASGIKPSDRFFPPVTPDAMQKLQQQMSQHVDPKVQQAQMQAQLDMQRDAHKQQLEEAAAQAEQQRAQLQAAFQQQMEHAKAERDAVLQMAKSQRDSQAQEAQLERQAQVNSRQAAADIAIKQMDAQHKAHLADQQFAFERQMQQMKFEQDRKLALLEAWLKAKTAGATGGEGGAPIDTSAIDKVFSNAGTFVDPRHTELLQRLTDSHAQLANAMGGLSQQLAKSHEQHSHSLNALAQSHAQHSHGLNALAAEIAKPKRQRIIRDANNRVVGSETIQ